MAGLVLLIGVLTSHPAAASAARSPYLHSSKPTGQEADWPEADRVSDLPGASNFSENYPVMYSGYLHLGGDPRRLMFYSLVLKSGKNETSDDSENIIMWTNGARVACSCSIWLSVLAGHSSEFVFPFFPVDAWWKLSVAMYTIGICLQEALVVVGCLECLPSRGPCAPNQETTPMSWS